MSGSDRSERVALVACICTAVIFLLGLSAGFYQAAQNPEPATSYERIEPNPGNDVLPTVASPNDFDFWQDPFPQWAMAVFAMLATAASVWAVILLDRTLSATREAVEQARLGAEAAQKAVAETARIGEAQVRRYLSVDLCTIMADWPNFQVTVHIANSGQSPAKAVVVYVSLTVNSTFQKQIPGEEGRTYPSHITAATLTHPEGDIWAVKHMASIPAHQEPRQVEVHMVYDGMERDFGSATPSQMHFLVSIKLMSLDVFGKRGDIDHIAFNLTHDQLMYGGPFVMQYVADPIAKGWIDKAHNEAKD